MSMNKFTTNKPTLSGCKKPLWHSGPAWFVLHAFLLKPTDARTNAISNGANTMTKMINTRIVKSQEYLFCGFKTHRFLSFNDFGNSHCSMDRRRHFFRFFCFRIKSGCDPNCLDLDASSSSESQ